MIDKNEKTYMWTNHYIKGISYINYVGVAADNINREPLLNFPKIMNITPSNVKEKFAFYMVFL